MERLPTTTITALHTAILAAMRAHFGSRIRQYGAYEPERVGQDPPERIETPALLLALDTTSTDATTERPDSVSGTTCRWVLLLIESQRTADLHLRLAELTIEADGVIFARDDKASPVWRGNHWGLGAAVQDPTNAISQPNALQGALNGRAARSLTWDQVAFLERGA